MKFSVTEFKKLPIMGILRCAGVVDIERLIETVAATGLRTIEIAMNSHDAVNLISRAVKTASGRLSIGAGTVLTKDILDKAIDAGASFIVMPTLVEAVTKICNDRKIPAFPGAFSPQEVFNAWNAGAAMVKVFPAAMFGPAYIRELKGPFDTIELLACGGVRADTIRSYFASGASAVAFGAGVFRQEWLDKRDYPNIEKSIKELIAHYAA